MEILLYISYYKLISLLALLLLCCSALVILVVAVGTRQRGTAPPGNQELGHSQHTLLPPGHREARGAGDVVMAYLAYSPTTTIYNASTTDFMLVMFPTSQKYNKFDFH